MSKPLKAAPVSKTVTDTTTTPVDTTITPVDTTVAITATPVDTTIAPVVVDTVPVAVPSAYEQFVSAIMADPLATAKQNIIISLNDYAVKMKPRAIQTEETGTENQMKLWGIIKEVLNSAEVDFKDNWVVLLAVFNANEIGSFAEHYVFRFFEHIRLDQDSIDAMQRILNLIHLTQDPATRVANLKRVDIERTIKVGISDTAKRNLLMFYTV